MSFFPPSEREIYTCPVTGKRYDPLAVKRALATASKSRFNDYCQDARSENPDIRDAAMDAIIATGRRALGLDPVDSETGRGWLGSQVYDAVVAFTEWLQGKDGRAQPTPNSAPCSDCP